MTQGQRSFGLADRWPGQRILLSLCSLIGLALIAIGSVLLTGRTSGVDTSSPPSVRYDDPVTAMHQTIGPANNSPALVADPTDGRFVVLGNRLDAPDFGCALHVSGDRGKSWTEVNPISELPVGADKCYAPEVAFGSNGDLFYLFVGLQGDGNQPMGAFLVTSTNRARTFSPPLQVLGPSNFGVRLSIEQGRDRNGRIHLAWLHASAATTTGGFGASPNPIMTAHSDDGGSTFSTPIQVSDPSRQRVVAPALALGPDGEVYIAYYDLGLDARDYQGLEGPTWDGSWSLLLSSSSDHGGSFDHAGVIEPSVIPSERVMLVFTMPPPAIAVNNKRLCVGWTDARFGDADVLARCSADRGSTWLEAMRLNDDSRGNGSRQFLPHLEFAPGGRLDAVFYDRRRNIQNIGNDIFYTWSDDDGASFAASVRLTGDPSDSRIGPRYAVKSAEGLVEIGSRIGVWSTDERVLAAWADTRNSLSGTTGQDVFISAVEFPSHSDWPRVVALLIIGGGFAAGLGSLIFARRRQVVSR